MMTSPLRYTLLLSCSLASITSVICAQTAPAPKPTPSLPAIIPTAPVVEAEVGPFHGAFELYDKARTLKDPAQKNERDSQLKIFANKINQLLKLYPQHPDALQGKYRRGTALNLIGENNKSNQIFFDIVHREKQGHLVAAAAFRLGINHYNVQEWDLALSYFDIAWRQSEKADMTTDALHRKIQCLSKLSRKAETLVALDVLINTQGIDDTLRIEAQKAQEKLKAIAPSAP